MKAWKIKTKEEQTQHKKFLQQKKKYIYILKQLQQFLGEQIASLWILTRFGD